MVGDAAARSCVHNMFRHSCNIPQALGAGHFANRIRRAVKLHVIEVPPFVVKDFVKCIFDCGCRPNAAADLFSELVASRTRWESCLPTPVIV